MIEQAHQAARRLQFLCAARAGRSRTWERDYDIAISNAWHVRRDAERAGDTEAADVADKAATEAEAFRDQYESATPATTQKEQP